MLRHFFHLPWLWGLRAARAVVPDEREGFRILLFHDVPENRLETFGRLIHIIKERYGILTPAQAESWLAGEAPDLSDMPGDGPPCLISFDDGFASNFRVAWEVLGPMGVSAAFFICPGLTDLSGEDRRAGIAKRIFDGKRTAASLAPDLRLMTWDEIRELRAQGHTIGAHGVGHRRLSSLQGDDLRREINESGDLLERRVGCRVNWFAYAFGDIGSISAPALEIIGEQYDFCRSGVRGLNSRETGHLALRADHIDLDAPAAYRCLTIEGGLDFRYADARRKLDRMTATAPGTGSETAPEGASVDGSAPAQ